MSLKIISRGVLAVALAAGVASAQLLNSKSLDVIRVEKTGISAGKIDSLAQMLAVQQFHGKKVNEETMTQVRYAVIDNLVGQELVKLECKKQGIKVSKTKVDSLTALFKKQFPSEDAFQKELKKSNTTMAQFKEKIEDQLKSEALLEKKVPYPKDPTEKQKEAFWELNKSKAQINDTISGARIYMSTKGKSKQEIEDAKEVLKGLAAQVRSKKATFAQLALCQGRCEDQGGRDDRRYRRQGRRLHLHADRKERRQVRKLQAPDRLHPACAGRTGTPDAAQGLS